MAENLKVCDLDPEVVSLVKKFRFRKEKKDAAIVLKIDPTRCMVVLDGQYKDTTPDEIQKELPEREPRYVIYSYCLHHDDGRISYPICFIFLLPAGVSPELEVMYGGTKNSIVNQMSLTKIFQLRGLEDFTDEWLKKQF